MHSITALQLNQQHNKQGATKVKLPGQLCPLQEHGAAALSAADSRAMLHEMDTAVQVAWPWLLFVCMLASLSWHLLD